MTLLLEVCIDSVAGALAAREGGADRLEVVGCLARGGITPSFGLVEQCVADVGLPVMMMIRPHDGNFAVTPRDMDTMLTDIEAAKSVGANGVVLGTLTPTGEIDVTACKELVAAADTLDVTFHRAFDLVTEPAVALEQLIELGCHRVLTSGQQASAERGISLLGQLHRQAEGRIQILPGAGINPDNAATIVRQTGVREIHASASVASPTEHGDALGLAWARRETCAQRVRAIKDAINA